MNNDVWLKREDEVTYGRFIPNIQLGTLGWQGGVVLVLGVVDGVGNGR